MECPSCTSKDVEYSWNGSLASCEVGECQQCHYQDDVDEFCNFTEHINHEGQRYQCGVQA